MCMNGNIDYYSLKEITSASLEILFPFVEQNAFFLLNLTVSAI